MPTVGGGRAGGGGGGFGGGRPGGSFGGGRPGGGFGGPHRPPRPGGFYRGPRWGWGPGWGWGWGWGPRWGWGFGGGFIGALLMIPIFLIIFAMIVVGSLFARPAEADITRSTRVRQPMSADLITAPIDEYFHDGAGVINNAAYQYQLENSLKDFYQRTGVQPYLYIDDDLDGNKNPSYSDVDRFLMDEYASLFGNDEGHLLVLYFEYPNGSYNLWYAAGNNISVVMDEEACDILLDYIEYYYDRSENYALMFINAFNSAADRIMGGRTSIFAGMSTGSILLLILAGVGVVVAIVVVIKRYRDTAPGNRGGNGPDGGGSYDGPTSDEDRRKEKYRRRYGG